MVVGRLLSFEQGHFSGATFNFEDYIFMYIETYISLGCKGASFSFTGGREFGTYKRTKKLGICTSYVTYPKNQRLDHPKKRGFVWLCIIAGFFWMSSAPIFQIPCFLGYIQTYCSWKKSQTTTCDVWNPINNGRFSISTGAGFFSINRIFITWHDRLTPLNIPIPESWIPTCWSLTSYFKGQGRVYP